MSDTPHGWVLIDPHSPLWESLVTDESEQHDVAPHPLTTHEYTRTTTYRLGSHTRTRTHRVISTFNPHTSNTTTTEETS